MKNMKLIFGVSIITGVVILAGCQGQDITKSQENTLNSAVLGTAVGTGVGAASGHAAGTSATFGTAPGAVVVGDEQFKSE